MKKQVFCLLLLTTASASAWCQTDIYSCVDSHGKTEYRNTGIVKGCKKLELSGVTVIPAPKRAATQGSSVKSAMATPSDFPRVDSGTQKARDSERRQILLDEMKSEEQKLANLKKDFNNGEPERRGDERNYAKYQERVALMKEDIDRAEKNIEALKRELGNLK